MKSPIIILSFLQLAVLTFAQDLLKNEFTYEVTKVDSPIGISKEKLSEASSFCDLNRFYKTSWIRAFVLVEIWTVVDGQSIKTMSKNDQLTLEHKDMINKADEGSAIEFKIKYLPENNLRQNEVKEEHFSVILEPEKDAEYIGGDRVLKQYLKNTIDQIPPGVFEGYDLAAIKFTIDQEGQIVNPHVMWSSNDEKTDQLLLETISKMPCWNPAQYRSGAKVKQEYAFTVGNPNNCMVNLIKIP